MLYYLFDFLEKNYQFTGASLFQYLSFRAGITFILALFISTVFGKRIINYLSFKQIGENIRELDLPGEDQKKGTPTMGGIIIIISTIIPIILFADFKNIYILILLISTLWLGVIGFIDDYIKVFKKNKKGLKGSFKIIGQVILGLYIGFTVYFNPEIKTQNIYEKNEINLVDEYSYSSKSGSLKTTIPFLKNNELDYEQIFGIKSTNFNWIFSIF